MSPQSDVRVFPDLLSLSRAAAAEFVTRAREAVQARGVFTVVLSGGSTPKTLYSLLADDPRLRNDVVWEKVHFFFSDERHVPPDHPDNNYRMAYRALLSKIPAPPWNAHRMATELVDATGVADYCEQVLREFFRLSPGAFPRFDLVLLGLGAEGHTASLFPRSPALKETKHLAVAAWVEALEAWRISLTLPVLNNASEVAFLVSGSEKAEALRNVLEGSYDPDHWPAQAVQPTPGRRVFFVDQAAAKELSVAG
ncbi:MAG: 6-phosphogluconolactonase [Acidobacteria bacterium]|nr:6-phosphogluconolactonase [Acidobacteriota bacterium]